MIDYIFEGFWLGLGLYYGWNGTVDVAIGCFCLGHLTRIERKIKETKE